MLDIIEEMESEKKSDFYRLSEVVDTETIGQLKKQAQINYLEFLRDRIKSNPSKANSEGAIYLEVLIERLKLINKYIDEPTKADGHYEVSYAGTSVNYRNILSRSEVFNMLPIITLVEGYLGETTDENGGELEFVFGLKLKLNGKANAHGSKTSFDYHLNLLNPDSKEHEQELADNNRKKIFANKVLKIAFLYFFAFASNNGSKEDYMSYDPIGKFDEEILPKLKEDDEAIKNIFRDIKKDLEDNKVQEKLDKIKAVLKKILESQQKWETKEYPVNICVKNSLLEQQKDEILNRETFFKPVLRSNPKEVLQYISIGDVNAVSNTLCTLPGQITISDIHYFSTQDRESFSMEYDIKGVSALPVIFAPSHRLFWEKNELFKERKYIKFSYTQDTENLESKQAFIYRFTFDLLAYTSLKVLLEGQERLFIPILRLQMSDGKDNSLLEDYMRSFSKRLSHLLNEEHRSNAQGIDIRKNLNYKIPNVMSSLYSVLPKKFAFPNKSDSIQSLDKLAIIVVSSRESDRRWNSEQKISNLMGEIVGVIRQKDGTVRLQLLKTFSDNYSHEDMFKTPDVIRDSLNNIEKLGFKHFLYIAKAPYSSTLHMTKKEDDDGLFFMSKEVISHLKKDRKDIKIYPMFFDKYYVVPFKKTLDVNSLYVQDITELENLVKDLSKRSVVFFNLFNGLAVGRDDERHYRGVISYATLLNIYKDILDDSDIHNGLILDGELKNDILQCLTLFHFSRYEKSEQKISFKLDPYENLIGDNSVGKLSLLNHIAGSCKFNSLAFLTEVKKVLNAPKRGN